MLTKTTNDVFIPGVVQLPYRPYSKTCPPTNTAPPAKRWKMKRVCGTKTITQFFVNTSTDILNDVALTKLITLTMITIPGFPAIVSVSPAFDPSLPTSEAWTLSNTEYCVTVKVYE